MAFIRHRDLHILTVNTYTYTTDLRFQTSHHRSTDEWTLQIKWVQKRDAGGEIVNFLTKLLQTILLFLNSIRMPSVSSTN